MAATSEYLVSTSGQMSLPAAVRRRWGLDHGGPVTVIDLGDVVMVLPADGRQRLLNTALSAKDHALFVAEIEDPDLATT